MKNRNQNHSNNWATPPYFYNELNKEFLFSFDPCPFMHDTNTWNGLNIEWRDRNFINPPYSRKEKESFILKAIEESKKGKLCVMLLPVSTSTKIFHNHILPNAKEIRFVKSRVKFIGINTKGEYTNWHLWDKPAPKDAIHVKNSGMHDSMIVVFKK